MVFVMSKFYLFLSVWLLCGTANAACAMPDLKTNQSNMPVKTAAAQADITGKIVKVNRASTGSENKDFLGGIYVEGSENYDRASINVKTQTRIYISRNGKRREAG